MRKREVQRTLVEHLVKESIFKQSVLSKYQITDTQTNTAAVEISSDEESERLDKVERDRLELQAQAKDVGHVACTLGFDVTKHIRMVPPFPEWEVDKYFLHFEKVAKNCGWPKEHWTMLLQSVLIGKAREIFSQISVEGSGDYDTVRELILKGYQLVPEAYRQKFRILTKTGNRTFTEFAQEKALLFNRWCTSEKINSYEKLGELILIEEFKNCLGTDIRTFVNDQKADKLMEAARLADNYSLTHKLSTGAKSQISLCLLKITINLNFKSIYHHKSVLKVDIRKISILITDLEMKYQIFIGNKIFPFNPLFVMTVSEKDTQFQNAMRLRTNNQMVQANGLYFIVKRQT